MSAAVTAPAIEDEVIVAAIRHVLPDVQAIYRHGSSVAGRMREDSDVDLAVLFVERLESDEVIALMGGLPGLGGRTPDIMQLRQAGPTAQFQVLKTGTLIYEDGSDARALFEMRAVRDYQDFRLRTGEIVDELIDSGWPLV